MKLLDALWAYQEAELKKEQVEADLRTTPSRIKLNKLHKLLKTQQATLTKLNEEIEGRMQQCVRLEEEAKKLEEQLALEKDELNIMQQDEESTAEEMTELRGDVEKLNREINTAVREAGKLMGELEKMSESYQSTRLTAGKAKKEYDQLRVVCEREKIDSSGAVVECEKELQRLEKNVDPALMERYNKVKQHHPAPIAKVAAGKCSGCNMSLPSAVLKKLSTDTAVVECENCGRILFDAE